MKLFILSTCCFIMIWTDFAFSLYFSMISVSAVISWYINSFMGSWNLDYMATLFLTLCMIVFTICLVSFFSSEINKMINLYQIKTITSMTLLIMWSFSTLSLLSFYVTLEMIFLFMFHYLMKSGMKMERKISAYYMFFFTMVTSLPLLIILFISSDTHKMNNLLMNPTWSNYWWLFVIMVFFVKMPMFGVHMWLPKAHVEAPLSGSVILSGILLKIGFYGVVRLIPHSKIVMTQKYSYIISLGWLSAALVATICLKQLDIKSMVAYSSVVHMSIACSSIFSMNETSLKATMFICFSHGLSSPMMFYGVYSLYNLLNSRSMVISKGTSSTNPLMALSLFLIMMASLGVPPLLSFFGEITANIGVLYHTQMLFSMTILMMFLSGVYMIYYYVYFSHGSTTQMCNKPVLSTEFMLVFFLMLLLILSPTMLMN